MMNKTHLHRLSRSTESRAIHGTRAYYNENPTLTASQQTQLETRSTAGVIPAPEPESDQCGEQKLNRNIQQKYQCGIKALFPCLLLKSNVGEIPGQARNDTASRGVRLSRFHNESRACGKRTNDDKRALARHKHLLTSLPTNLLTSVAFTMAEILLSLTIIGVVAAITLPSLTGNINERTWNTQRKALYARMSQAISLMPALNGYGTVTEATSTISAVDTATETFLTAGLAKVLKINNICSDNFKDCGIISQVKDIAGTNVDIPKNLYSLNGAFNTSYGSWSYYAPNTKAVAFETANGESVVAYYNPICHTEYLNTELMAPTVCVNFIYDLNGSKGPNTVAKILE